LRSRRLQPEHLGTEAWQQGEREVAVSDRAAEGTSRGALGVDVDPLVVVGGVGEGVHPSLVDRQPFRGADLLPGGVRYLLEAGEGAHQRNLPTRLRSS